MKRVISVVLTLVMMLSYSIVGLAGESTADTVPFNKNDIIVIGILKEVKEEIIYKVDVTWGAMTFTYDKGGQTWDTENHKYVSKSGSTGSWTSLGNNITVTNHSNADIKTTLGFSQSYVSGKFYSTNSTASEITAPFTVVSALSGTAQTKSAYLILSGAPSSTWLANPSLALGTISISISG